MASALAACLLLSFGLTSAAEVRFLVLGDFGEHGSDQQRPVAESLGRVATYFGPLDFVLTVGDNIYDHGITDVKDPLWKRNLNDIYTDPALDGVCVLERSTRMAGVVLTPCSLHRCSQCRGTGPWAVRARAEDYILRACLGLSYAASLSALASLSRPLPSTVSSCAACRDTRPLRYAPRSTRTFASF